MENLTLHQHLFINEMNALGGVSLGCYGAAMNRIGLIDEAIWDKDVKNILEMRKNSLDVKLVSLNLASIPQGEN